MYSKKLIPISLGICLLVLVMVIIGCSSSTSSTSSSDSSGTSTSNEISFKNDVLPVLTSNCVVCHQGSSPPGNLNLEPANAFNDLVNAPSIQSSLMLVDPGAPDKSYLMNKLNGTQTDVGGSGVQMPYGAPPLSQAQIATISRWISENAPDN
jgi:hypothetical protein